jgi:hypothetical protein
MALKITDIDKMVHAYISELRERALSDKLLLNEKIKREHAKTLKHYKQRVHNSRHFKMLRRSVENYLTNRDHDENGYWLNRLKEAYEYSRTAYANA